MKKRVLAVFLSALIGMQGIVPVAAEQISHEDEILTEAPGEPIEESVVETVVELDSEEVEKAGAVVKSGECGDNLTWALTDDGVLTISGTGDMWEPAAVSALSYPWFDYNSSIQEVIIETGVTNIGMGAFGWDFTALRSIELPDGLTRIGRFAFQGCSSLTNIEIPVSVTSIGYYAFADCSSLTNIEIPMSVTSIDSYAFADCSSLESVHFSGNAPLLGTDMFESVTATVYYPANNTWTEDVMQDYGGTIIWESYIPDIELSTYMLTLEEGEEETISVTINNDDHLVSWESGDTSVAIVDNGMVTGVSAGKTVITVTFASGRVVPVNVIVKRGIVSLELDSTATAVIVESGDTAYFSFVPEETDTYVFYSMSEEDTLGYLYDAEMNEIASDDEMGEGSNFSIKHSLDAGEQYYFGAKFYNIKDVGSFDVRLEVASDEPASDNGQCGDSVYWSLEEKTLTISGEGDMWNYSFDDKTNRVPWYDYHEEIQSVTIENGVTSIGGHAFENCDSLTSITIPASVTSIGYYAFKNCYSLTGIMIPASVSSIRDGAFEQCGLTNITIPASVTSIGDYAFAWCGALTSILFEGNAPEFSFDDFMYSHSHAFYDIIATAYYPPNDSTWTEDVRQNYLGTITWVPNIPGVELSTYKLGLQEGEEHEIIVTISNEDQVVSWESGDTSIAIVDNGMVTGVSAGKTVITITFASGYTASVSVTVRGPVKNLVLDEEILVEYDGMEESGKFVFIPEEDGTYIFYSKYANGYETDTRAWLYGETETNELAENDDGGEGSNFEITYDLNAGSRYILKTQTYSGDAGTYLVGVKKEQGAAAENQCGDDVYWSLEDGVLTISGTGDMWDFESEFQRAPWYNVMDQITNVQIEDGVESIGAYAFYEFCTNLSSIEIPDSITRIGDGAFGYCSSLTSATIPESLTSIAASTFMYCESLTSVTIPEGIKSIGYAAFLHCSNLSEIRFEGDAPLFEEVEYGSPQFMDVTATAYFPANNPTWISDVMQDYGGTITWVPYDPSMPIYGEPDFILPASTITIEESAFEGNQMTVVYIPDTCTSIAAYAFKDCSSITQIRIPANCEIDDNAFDGCEGVYIFGTAGSDAESYCGSHDGFTFVEE